MTAKRSPAARGYGPAHRRTRQAWQPAVEAGTVRCARCGNPIHPEEPWDLDHTPDRRGYLGPSHRTCNRTAGARLGAQRRWAKTPPARPNRSRNW